MLKKKHQRLLSDEHREWKKRVPRVVVRKRTVPHSDPFYEPRFKPQKKLEITDSELINAEDEEQDAS